MHLFKTVLVASLLGSCLHASAQALPADSTTHTTKTKKPLWQPIPKKAGLYSALIPGLGQMYNRQFWKLPIVYGGLGVAGYFVVRNAKDYNSLRQAYIGRLGPGPYTDEYVGIYNDVSQLKQLQDDANRLLNMTVVLTGAAYLMQVIDAVTSAHLRNFDISRDISMQVHPVATPVGAGMALVVNFR
jgi:hypothetical protein